MLAFSGLHIIVDPPFFFKPFSCFIGYLIILIPLQVLLPFLVQMLFIQYNLMDEEWQEQQIHLPDFMQGAATLQLVIIRITDMF